MAQGIGQSNSAADDPGAEYQRRLEAHKREAERRQRRHIFIGNTRLILAVVAAAILWMAVSQHWMSAAWVAAPVTGFIVLAVIHERVLRERDRSVRAVRFYRRAIDRLNDQWAGNGESGERFCDDTHVYSSDLDLFGKGSLFELLSIARTRAGEETLARWLTEPAGLEEIRARQQAIEELRGRLDLREDLALLGEEVRSGIDAQALPKWAASPPLLDSTWARILAASLAVVTLASFLGWVSFGLTARMFFLSLGLDAILGLVFRKRVLRVVAEVEEPAHDLALLAQVLHRLEQERFVSPKLAGLRQALDTRGWPPSRRIANLGRLMELLDSRDHLVVRLIGPPLLWTTQLAFAIEAWRKFTGTAVGRWMGAVGEIGALISLAGYAYEHPDDPFPEFVEGVALFEAEAMGHPLIPKVRSVRNDLKLGGGLSVLMVSGSNMSGKSTLLRTVGINVVLAMTGAPVRARRLRLSPLSVGASIKALDSLQAGSSRFFTQITRLRQLLDLAAGPIPLLFLLDELLHGTNSHDRRIGAEAVVGSLVKRGAVGLVTTHDLALATIVDSLSPHGANIHFQDHLESGVMMFDYKLQPGVVEKSNALELMRSVGLEI